MENFSKTELKNEKWKDIDGYNGAYQVSDLGRVRSKKYGRWKVLRARKNTNGYLSLMLCKNGNAKRFSVHRLVADAFIANDNIFNTEVNHKDENKQNNRVSNLEWCDRQYNMTYNGLRYRSKHHHPKYKQTKIKDIYDPNLTYDQNIEVLMANGIECSTFTLWKLRQDLGLIKNNSNK